MKILCYAVSAEEKPYLKNWSQQHQIEVKMVSAPLAAENVYLAQGYTGISSVGTTPVSEKVYAALEKFGIKQLAVRQVGVDNQDLQAAKKHHITITNVRSYSPRAIAEMGVTQALYLLRKIGIYQNQMAQGNFTWDPTTVSTEIFNCTVGLIGTGHIGGASAQIYSALGAKVLAYDPNYNADLEPYLTFTDLETVLKTADILSLHVPLLPATKKMIDWQALKKMKSTAILINVARGELVDTSALITALKNQEIAAAGLDTLADEAKYIGQQLDLAELPQDYQILSQLPNVLLTPHVAFFTKLAVKNYVEIALNDAVAVIKGKRPQNLIC